MYRYSITFKNGVVKYVNANTPQEALIKCLRSKYDKINVHKTNKDYATVYVKRHEGNNNYYTYTGVQRELSKKINKKQHKQLKQLSIIENNFKSINGTELTNKIHAKILYHGSRNGIHGDISPYFSRDLCDFGQAFYTGDFKEQAKLLVKDNGDMKLVYQMYADLNPSELSIYTFNDQSIEECKLWALYIAHNRNKISIDEYPKLKSIILDIDKHDVVIGLIADDEMTQAFNEFLADALTIEGLFYCLSRVKLGHQYCFKTQKACRHLHYIDIKPYNKNDDTELCELHIKLKKQNINVIEDAKDRYTKGKRFRELIREYK